MSKSNVKGRKQAPDCRLFEVAAQRNLLRRLAKIVAILRMICGRKNDWGAAAECP
jgi:hypothetical protein